MRPRRPLTRALLAAVALLLTGCAAGGAGGPGSSGGATTAPDRAPTQPAPSPTPTSPAPTPDPRAAADQEAGRRAVLAAAAALRTAPALDRWRAALATRDDPAGAGAVVVVLGDSGAAGVGASTPTRRWVDVLTDAWRRPAEPHALDLGPDSPVGGAGLRVLNGGVSGATVASTLSDRALLAAARRARPDLVVVALGGNDHDGALPLPEVARALERLLASFATGPDGQVTSRPSVLLVGDTAALRPARVPGGPPASAYREVVAAAVAGDPRRRAYLDVSRAFPQRAVDDVGDLVTPDDVHLSDRGHARYAALLQAALSG